MNRAEAYAAAALTAECEAVANLPNEKQAMGLNIAALRIGGFVKAGALSRAEARAALLNAGLQMRNYRRDRWTRTTLLVQIDSGLGDAATRLIPDRDTAKPQRDRPAANHDGPPRDFEAEEREREREEKRQASGIFKALRLFNEAQPARGSPVETYLASRNIVWSDTFADLRFHPSCPRGSGPDAERLPAMVALFRDVATGEGCGLHRTFLNPQGTGKIEHGDQKLMLGRCSGAAIMLTAAADVTTTLGLSEGIENGLTAITRGWTPIWAAGSAALMQGFPVLRGVEALTLYADPGDAGVEAAQRCARRWLVPDEPEADWKAVDQWLGVTVPLKPPRHIEVAIKLPRGGGDWNDSLIRENAA